MKPLSYLGKSSHKGLFVLGRGGRGFRQGHAWPLTLVKVQPPAPFFSYGRLWANGMVGR